MDPTRLIKIPGVLTRVTGTDMVTEDHVPVTEIEDVAVKCWVEQYRSSEDTDSQDQQAEDWRIYLWPGTGATGSDRLTVQGMVLELAGPPWPATNPRTQASTHVEAKGRRVQ